MKIVIDNYNATPNESLEGVKPNDAFSKSSIPQFSNEIYSVVNASGSVITLDNGNTYKRNSVLKVVNSAAPIFVNPIDENINKKNVDRGMRQLGQENADIDEPRQKRSTAAKRK